MSGCLVKIRQGLESFKPSEKKVAQFILDTPREIKDLSITELAKKSNTSEASIVRFCKSLELKGYQELKLAVSLETSRAEQGEKVLFEQIGTGDSTQEIISKVSSGNIQAIEDTKNILSSEELEKAIETIDKAKSINIFGLGASSVVALDAQYKFMRINIPTHMYFDSHIQMTSAVHLTKEDVAIGISYSGRTKEIVEAMKVAKKKGAKTIAITQFGDSPLAGSADIKLYTAAVENNFRSGAMASRIAQLTVIDSLFIGVACRRYDEVIEHLYETREVVKDRKY
ncbi:transcriptional regulator, RpiR family [Alkaliphilus metalliredigens QYMF]|uniref:Transcriptional regulator, RpiR family n=1 Tax=Alkaliphilus metalliredigens (strain QYMF) TaxID=293826 RepID=A6TVQ3_ALKMQ|nr:MurR/RpiR family transcriptional regulator [Alkaliphilus metalliredigens]ABR50271.1 transcriptional regulator, RpiR family [Alkaliphilus metalliredigens QYMF]